MTKEYFEDVIRELCGNYEKSTDTELIRNGDQLLMNYTTKEAKKFSGSISINSLFDKVKMDELSRQQVADLIISEIKKTLIDDFSEKEIKPKVEAFTKALNFIINL